MAEPESILALFERHNAFPVLQPGTRQQEYIPYNIIAPHEAQAMKNHGQTLQRLAERGGLSWCEVLAVLKNKTWKEMGWRLVKSKEMADRENQAKEDVLAYIKERTPHCGC